MNICTLRYIPLGMNFIELVLGKCICIKDLRTLDAICTIKRLKTFIDVKSLEVGYNLIFHSQVRHYFHIYIKMIPNHSKLIIPSSIIIFEFTIIVVIMIEQSLRWTKEIIFNNYTIDPDLCINNLIFRIEKASSI